MAPQKTLTPAAFALMGTLALLWGGSFLSARLALDQIGPFWLVCLRCGLAAAVLWVVIALRRDRVPRGVWGRLAVMGTLNNAVPFTLLCWGQLHIESGLTSILNASTALWGVLIAALVFADERLTPARLGGVCLGVAGVALAIGPEALRGLDLRSLAQLAVIGATLSYGLAGTFARARMGDVPPLISAAGTLTWAAFLMLPLALWLEGAPPRDLAPLTLGALGWYAVASTSIAYLLYFRLVAAAGTGNALLVTLLVAPVAILLGALVLGEALHPSAFAGFALIAAGLGLLSGRLRLPRPARP